MNTQISHKGNPYIPISQRRFVSLLKFAYLRILGGRFTTIHLRNGDTLLLEVDNQYDLMWLNSRRQLQGWGRVELGVWAHPNAVRVTTPVYGLERTHVYASVSAALVSGAVIPSQGCAPDRTGLHATYANLSYLADCEKNAIRAMEELRTYHNFMVGQ